MDVYVEPVRTRYTANGLGAWLLILFCWAAVVIAPLAIGFGMGQFWLTSNVLVGRARVTYTNRLVVRVETNEGSALSYISSPKAMEELEASIADASLDDSALLFSSATLNGAAPVQTMYPAINLFEDDQDSDGTVDAFHFQIAIPMNYSASSVARICVMPEFFYDFDYDVPSLDIKMTAAPVVCALSPNAPTPFEAARVEGDLLFKASVLPESSEYVRYDRVYLSSLFNSFTAQELAELAPVASAYALRNFTMAVEEKASAFGAYNILSLAQTNIDPTTTLNQFNFELTLRVHDSVIRYVPPWFENFKFGWVQYFCIAFVVYHFLDLIKSILVKQALINTIAIWESRQRVVN